MPTLKIGRHKVEITHPDKVLFPDLDLTKQDLVDYYEQVAPAMLPHLRNRAVTMNRYPNGIKGPAFIQQEAGDYFPDYVKRALIERKGGGSIVHVVIDNPAALIYLANQGVIVFHVWASHVDKLDYPDRMIFDLDPPDNDFRPVRFAALALREMLEDDLGLPAFVMTTGSRGLHLAVPLDRKEDFESVRGFAQEICGVLEHRHPDRLTTAARKEQRRGRLFLDTVRNAYGQTAVAPYSVRAKPGAPVAAPLLWPELDDPGFDARHWDVQNIIKRLEKDGDPWKDIGRKGHSLTAARSRLKSLQSEMQEIEA